MPVAVRHSDVPIIEGGCMRLPAWLSGWSAALTVMCAISVAAWAGGAGFGDDDDTSAETGPSYFGFVRDTNGATVPGAKVTVAVKNHGSVITRTDALGTYRCRGSAPMLTRRTSRFPATSRVTSRRVSCGAPPRAPIRKSRSRPNALSSASKLPRFALLHAAKGSPPPRWGRVWVAVAKPRYTRNEGHPIPASSISPLIKSAS